MLGSINCTRRPNKKIVLSKISTPCSLNIMKSWKTIEVFIPKFISEFTIVFERQRDCRHLFHFTMRLYSEFEPLRCSILHRHYLFTLIKAVREFTSKEIDHQMLSFSPVPIHSAPSPTVLIAPHRLPPYRRPYTYSPRASKPTTRGR